MKARRQFHAPAALSLGKNPKQVVSCVGSRYDLEMMAKRRKFLPGFEPGRSNPITILTELSWFIIMHTRLIINVSI
jgi:hypothetical protein